MKLVTCPRCGKISLRFPIHTCKRKPAQREKKAAAEGKRSVDTAETVAAKCKQARAAIDIIMGAVVGNARTKSEKK